MNRNAIIALLVLVVGVAAFSLFSSRPGDEDEIAGVGNEPGIAGEPADPIETTALADDPVAANGTGPAVSDTRAAADAATDEAVESLALTGEPVQGALDEIRAIVEEAGVVGAADEFGGAPQDGPTLRAYAIDTAEASDPAFVATTLSPETFEAERVIALIDASPRLTDDQRTELIVAIQAVSETPEARDRVLAELETILLPEG
jgi:hypothetical protein